MNTEAIKRFSPIALQASPVELAQRDGWDVVLGYEGEKSGPWLVDLSHRSKFDIQSRALDTVTIFGKPVPGTPGECMLAEGWLVNRMNRTQAALWDLDAHEPGPPVKELFATETTDGQCLLALVGDNLPRVMEKLTRLDCFPPGKATPFLIQGPAVHIPMQVVIFERGSTGVVLMAFSRGYGQAVADAIMGSCREFPIRPGGEKRFTEAFASFGG